MEKDCYLSSFFPPGAIMPRTKLTDEQIQDEGEKLFLEPAKTLEPIPISLE